MYKEIKKRSYKLLIRTIYKKLIKFKRNCKEMIKYLFKIGIYMKKYIKYRKQISSFKAETDNYNNLSHNSTLKNKKSSTNTP